jgi:Spy/CpxP family protein refolding chaperone
MVTTMMLGLSLLAAAPQASAIGGRGGPGFFGGRGGHGAGAGREARLPLRLLVAQMTPAQRGQVKEILMADRGTRRDLMTQLRAAHQALSDKMLGAGTVGDADVQPELQKIAELHRQLLEHGTKVMLQVRAVATPEQLTQAATAKQRIDKLHDEIEALLGQPLAGENGPAD